MIPRAALFLGLAGLIPFLWGALTLMSPDMNRLGQMAFGSRFTGNFIVLNYGTIILAFMSGVLWGFATKAEGAQAATGYALSVIPALWAFIMVGGGAKQSAIFLIAGYIGLLGLDWTFWRQGLAPEWWMRLRILLTTIVVACIAFVGI